MEVKSASNSEAKKSAPNKELEIMKERMTYAIACVLVILTQGKKGRIVTKKGLNHEGNVYTITGEGCVFKECHTDRGIEATMSFDKEDYVSLEFTGVKPVQHRKFRTDAEISKRKTMHDRELQKWEPEGDTESMGLEDSGSGTWDQFRINEQKFGVKTTYDEHLYTTKVPKLNELTEEEIRKAELLTKELEGGKDDYNEEDDEEARYGAVLGSGRYKEFKPKKTPTNSKKQDRRAPDNLYSAFKSVESKNSFRSVMKSKEKPPEYPKKELTHKHEANNNEIPPTHSRPVVDEKINKLDDPEAKPDQTSSGIIEADKSPLKRERVISVNTDLKLGYKKVRQQLRDGKFASPIYPGVMALNPEVCTTPVDDEVEKLYWEFLSSQEKSREEEMKEFKNFSSNIGSRIKSISRVIFTIEKQHDYK